MIQTSRLFDLTLLDSVLTRLHQEVTSRSEVELKQKIEILALASRASIVLSLWSFQVATVSLVEVP